MIDETSRSSRQSVLKEKLRTLVSNNSSQTDDAEAERPAVWSNAEEMFASEFA